LDCSPDDFLGREYFLRTEAERICVDTGNQPEHAVMVTAARCSPSTFRVDSLCQGGAPGNGSFDPNVPSIS
jgi:hypothetical protein